MKKTVNNQKGFTLIEIIFVLIIVGIMATVVGLGLVQVVQGMVFTKMNANTIQKGQIAMTKLVKEFNNISAVTAANATSITFTSYKKDVSNPNNVVLGSHIIALSGNNITFDGDTVTDQVNDFSFSYYDNFDTSPQSAWQTSRRIIEIKLKLTGASNTVSSFQARVTPRNLQ